MDEFCSLNGNWIGFYEYGKGYPEKLRGKKIFFKAAIAQNKGSFIGKIREKDEMGVPDEIYIKGTIIEDRIIFTKHHTKMYAYDENFDIVPEPLLKDTILQYRGKYIESESKFIGVWESPESDYTSGGVWEMWENPAGP
jgi:hypothetical protein